MQKLIKILDVIIFYFKVHKSYIFVEQILFWFPQTWGNKKISNIPHTVAVLPQQPKAHIDEEAQGNLSQLHILTQAASNIKSNRKLINHIWQFHRHWTTFVVPPYSLTVQSTVKKQISLLGVTRKADISKGKMTNILADCKLNCTLLIFKCSGIQVYRQSKIERQ